MITMNNFWSIAAQWVQLDTLSLIGVLFLWREINHQGKRMDRLEAKLDQVIFILLAQSQGKQVSPDDLEKVS